MREQAAPATQRTDEGGAAASLRPAETRLDLWPRVLPAVRSLFECACCGCDVDEHGEGICRSCFQRGDTDPTPYHYFAN